ncbi:MAG: hypothetical protein JRJ59_08925, partial [Deltaproteobacteria bacterium]|nr:hypothetical protein [Deltaproteobacteria bacterium]
MSYWFSETNLLTEAQLNASSTAAGVVGHPLKEGTGSAAAATDGPYSGSSNRSYT